MPGIGRPLVPVYLDEGTGKYQNVRQSSALPRRGVVMDSLSPLSPIRKIGHVAFHVSDPLRTAAYYERVLGLKVTCESMGSVALSSSGQFTDGSALELVLHQGAPAQTSTNPSTNVQYIAFEVDDDKALESWIPFLEQQGIRVRYVEDGLVPSRHAIQFSSPYGWDVQLGTAVRDASITSGNCQAVTQSAVPFRVTKLGHVTFGAPVPTVGKSFAEKVLQFRLSENIGDKFYWLRCNVDHHSIAFCASSRVGVHHVGLELCDWSDFRNLGDHFKSQGVRLEYGPGRHASGGNIFVYFVDPDGIRFELFAELARIYNEAEYVPRSWDPRDRKDTVNQWGPAPPPSYLE